MDPLTNPSGTGPLPLAEAGATTPAADRRAWLEAARARVDKPGRYLVHQDGDQLNIRALTTETTRIGRSLNADLRFDDTTVSRRHALIRLEGDAVIALDDRSTNGVFVNGTRIERKLLEDGDELAVGRHSLIFLDTTTAASEPPPPALAGSA